MKRILALLLSLAMVLAMTACSSISDGFQDALKPGTTPEEKPTENPAVEKPEPKPETPKENEPEEPEDPEEPEEPMTDPEPSQGLDAYDNPCDHPHEGADLTAYNGIYRAKLPQGDDDETWLQITGYNDFILLEYHGMMEGSVYRYWAEEFWPADGWYTSINADTVSGKSQTFTSMAQYENYSELPRNRCITLTDDGVILNYDDADAEYYLRDDGFDGGHTAPAEMRNWFDSDVHLDFDYQYDSREVLGTWGFWTGWDAYVMTLTEQGVFSLVKKTANRPIEVYHGVFGFGTNSGNLEILAERIGYGGYPYAASWEWFVDEYGYMNITDGDSVLFEGGCLLWQVEHQFFTAFDASSGPGYILESFLDYGDYTDQYGTEYYYYYSLPQIYHSENSDLNRINNAIYDAFNPLIEMELEAMESGEFLSYDHVDWQSAVYEGVLYLHVYAYAYDWEEHATFYVDVETMEVLDAREVLARLNLDETYFLDTLRTNAEEVFLSYFSDLSEEDWENLGMDECLEQTLSPEFIHPYLPIFVDSYGTITVYITLSHPAGSGLMWVPVCPFEPVYEEAVG